MEKLASTEAVIPSLLFLSYGSNSERCAWARFCLALRALPIAAGMENYIVVFGYTALLRAFSMFSAVAPSYVSVPANL